ncbi:MAG: thiamine diphosphokinase [Defluviitaleaceae bacterium]|nr:thiamine diphosphokinase [Defluviitaleaceae bacterium]
MKIVIFANGEVGCADFAGHIAASANFVIFCDGGSRHGMNLGIRPDVIVGDLDSIDADVLAYFQDMDVVFEKFPAAKESTDLELAIGLAMTKNPAEIIVLGAFGGRVDHFLGNIHALIPVVKSKVKASLVDFAIKAMIIHEVAEITRESYDTISLIPLTSAASGVTTAGLKYPLRDEVLHIGTTRGISNIFVENTASVTVAEGLLLAICTKTT